MNILAMLILLIGLPAEARKLPVYIGPSNWPAIEQAMEQNGFSRLFCYAGGIGGYALFVVEFIVVSRCMVLSHNISGFWPNAKAIGASAVLYLFVGMIVYVGIDSLVNRRANA